MSNYANAKATIAANIYTNHLGQVTAEMVKTAANSIVDTLIAGGYLYAGIAKLTPTQTNPGSPDANVFYIATEPGTYTNFVGAGGSLVVADGEVAIFKFNGTWSKEVTGAATAAQVTELGQEIDHAPTIEECIESGLSICDLAGNSVAILKDGEVVTKNFNSRNTAYTADIVPDLAFSDKNGNVILEISNGHICTKNFDSRNPAALLISGRNVLVYHFGGNGNDWCFVRTPENYDYRRAKPYPFVICNHGNGWSMNGSLKYANWTEHTQYRLATDPEYIANPDNFTLTDDESLVYSNPTIEALLSAGYVVCGCENYGDALYGNENCRTACAAFFEHMTRNYNVEKRCCMIGASNGAQASINAAYILGERVKAMILQYPLTCLVNQYFERVAHQAGIRAAYGIEDTEIDRAGLISATRTHDVLHTDTIDVDLATNRRLGYFPPTKLYYSLDDNVTKASVNALPLFDYLENSMKIVEKKQCTGSHGDSSHFAPDEFVAWFNQF